MKDINDIIRTVERRVISMRLTARHGGYSAEQKDMACAYVRQACTFIMRRANRAKGLTAMVSLLLDSRVRFLFQMSDRNQWEDSNETAEHEA